MNKIKSLFVVLFLYIATASAQEPGWLHKDLKTDSIFGISSDKAYKELLKGKKSKKVIVAVIDAGMDYKHEDLKSIAWINPKEKAGNGKDDDKNGYIDDVYGWNFLGSAKGSVTYDNLEMTRIVKNNPTSPLKDTLDQKIAESTGMRDNILAFKTVFDDLIKGIGTSNPDKAALAAYKPTDSRQQQVQRVLLSMLDKEGSIAAVAEGIKSDLKHFEDELKYNYNINYNSRDTVGDDINNVNEKIYGNAHVDAFDTDHGTHVAGIIAADRTNNLGIMGVADNVIIMPVRTVPTGDERDKDVANAIYYAVNNGAKVINMSFGKGYSPNKEAVDKAVKYAVSKDVLLVHAAGNESKNIDTEKNFPTATYLDGSDARSNWIEVGASAFKDGDNLTASFTNYGAKMVDLFAPGVKINSTTPGSKYEDHSGTSMAAPVVAGVAALVREYYPKLTAAQVKEILMKSVTKVSHDVKLPGDPAGKLVPFSDLCVAGGIVNVYSALQLAATYK
ncbi:MAG: peptidase S8 [Pedobacter sp.]|nr:MAG: peptidase S8 [Pedobacter sp.]